MPVRTANEVRLFTEDSFRRLALAMASMGGGRQTPIKTMGLPVKPPPPQAPPKPRLTNCRNCAAPLESSKCEYCGSRY